MDDYRNDCCEPCEPCCRPERECCRPSSGCCSGESGNGFGILILLLVLYFLFCGNDNGRNGGGLFSGLF